MHPETQAEGTAGRVNWNERGAALLPYLGAAPLLHFLPRYRLRPYLAHHNRQALAIAFLFFGIIAVFIAVVLAASYAMVHHRGFYESTKMEGRLLDISWKLFLCWLVFWAYGGGLALLGSTIPLPIVGRVMKRPILIRATAVVLCAVYLLGGGVRLAAWHAESLTRTSAEPGQAYFLYEDVDRFPRWLFALGFYRMSRAARETFGPQSVVMLRLDRQAIARAVNEARFLFIGSHGRAQGLLLDGGYVKPHEVRAMQPNPGLDYVYLTSCDGGAQADAWEAAFAPAQVITFPRLTAVVEHIYWMWFKGPKVIRGLTDN